MNAGKLMEMPKVLLVIIICAVWLLSGLPIYAQTLDSTNYRLVEPTMGPISGISDSASYSQLIDTSVGNFTSTSVNYQSRGGSPEFFEANIPLVSCFETTTNGGSTTCTGLPGTDGMQGVCSLPGCYDRAKLEIDAQANPADARYAIQISTSSDFSSNVFYVDASTRFLKANLTIADFIPKCEWEGFVSSGVCGSANGTWQKYNVLGLAPNSTYYVRLSAQLGGSTDANFTQSEWGLIANATTDAPSISVDVDIAPDTSTPTSPPYILSLGSVVTGIVVTSSDKIIFRVTTNALSGVQNLVKGANGGLFNSSSGDTINAVNANLDSSLSGYGLRNEITTNSAQNTASEGTIVVSSSPSNFTDSGSANGVGAPTAAFVKLFDSGSLPLHTGVSGYEVKVRPDSTHDAGNYTETLNFVVFGTF